MISRWDDAIMLDAASAGMEESAEATPRTYRRKNVSTHYWTRTQHLVLAQWVCLSSSDASGEDDLGGMLYSLGVFIIGLGCTAG